jgi:ribosomal RNA-processing protein 8
MAKRKRQEISSAPKDPEEKESLTEVWSKSKKKRMRMLRSKQRRQEILSDGSPKQHSHQKKDKKDVNGKRSKQSRDASEKKLDVSKNTSPTKQSVLQQAFIARLTGSRFRELNEALYTSTSEAAFKKFSSNPDLYNQYHEGFRHQVMDWPVNPVHVIVKWIVSNFQSQSSCVVADFGCGDAELAKRLLKVKHKGKCPFKVHSFDLVASCDLVTACDMASVPIKDESVDVAVFCLSLMGTNLADFIREAHRVLKATGVLKIAEVRSRFESTSKRDELDDFLEVLDRLGFECRKNDRTNKMFVLLECKKNDKKPDTRLSYSAKPCIYKRR